MQEIDLNNQLSNISFVEKVKLQIEKDFRLTGNEIELGFINEGHEIFEKVEKALEEINQESIFRLAYLMSINEKKLMKILTNISDSPFQKVAFLIVEACAKKVYLRQRLS